MKKHLKLFGVIAIAAILALTAGLTAVAFAQSPEDEANSDGATSQSEACSALLDRVCQIYQEKTGVAIDPQQLKDAFAQARSEMMDEALASHLQNLVDEGKITQDQANQYQEWWQVRPDIPLPGPFGHGMMWGRGCRVGPYPAPKASDSGL